MNKDYLLDFIKKHKISYAIGIIFMILTSYIQTLFPKVLGTTIDILKVHNFDFSKVKLNVLYLILIAVLTFITTFTWRNCVIVNARKLECTLRESLFDHFQKLSPSFYNRHKTGDLIAYAINDISAVRMTFGPATANTINGTAICLISIYSMSRVINWKITFLSLLPIPLIVYILYKIGSLIQKRFKIVQENFGSISDRVQENIYGIRVIKAYVQEDKEVENFETLNNNMMKSNINMVKTSSYLAPLIEACFSISFVVNLIIGGRMVLQGKISLGDFVAFNGYITMIMNPVISIGRIITIFQRGMASYKRLNKIFKEKPDIVDGHAMLNCPIKGSIEFKNLNFSYKEDSENTIKNLSFKIPAGSTIGIIGETGSGKSTLMNLLLKLYNVENGKILIDRRDINDYSLKALREGFGYVPQDGLLFSASIKDNIRFFKDKYSNKAVEAAAINSCIYDSIIALPDGFDTILGERGVNLSGGQKQRISIARALVKDPPVLILDDALSAVDTITESKIISNLKEVRKNKTTIIIAHRISAIEDADKIIVLKHGKIIEAGNHKELLNKGGLYYETYVEQFNERKNGIYAS